MRPQTRNARRPCAPHGCLPESRAWRFPHQPRRPDPRVRSLTPQRRTQNAKACSTRMRTAHSREAAIHSCRLVHLPRSPATLTCRGTHTSKHANTAHLRKTPASAVAPAWPKARQRALLAGSSARQREGGGGRRSARRPLNAPPREE